MKQNGNNTRSETPVLYGGQAVIEGVMMRGPKHAAIAVRRTDGSIQTTAREILPFLVQYPALNKPILRGAFALFDAMRLGIWSLRWSANEAMKDALALEAAKAEAAPDNGKRKGLLQKDVSEAGEGTVKGTMGVGLLIGVGLFIALPTILTGALKGALGPFWLNVVEGVIRLALFFGYLKVITALDGVRRIFEFHGAEHRVINAMEAQAPLTSEACRPFGVIHPRCGTSFMILVLLLATLVYTLFGWHTWWLRLVIRIGLLPVIAGFAYELLRLAGTVRGSALLNVISWPGRFSQKFTTREPDDSQTEVAIAALEAVFAAERGESSSEETQPVLA